MKRIKDTAYAALWYLRQKKADYYLKRIGENKISDDVRIIRVGFLVQMQEIWDKQAPVYEKLNSDGRFIVSLIVIPPRDFGASTYSFGKYEKLLLFFKTKYPMADIQKAYDKQWLDLPSKGFDYVFYPTCWDKNLPSEYRPQEVIKYAKTCYIPYGAGGFRYDKQFYYKRSFFLSLYINFCNAKERVSLFPKSPYKHTLFLGSPLIDCSITGQKSIDTNSKRILWTPRWTTEEIYGGTTFFVYKDKILTLKTKFPNIDLILRPHPHTFQNALLLGKMTERDIEDYKISVEKHGASFDKNEMVGDTFRQTGILITDYSSIILEFFLSGKPVIYCGKTNICFDEIYEQIVQGFYIADNWEQLEETVQKLLKGEDDLKTKRMNIIADIKKQHIGATERIVNFLIKDAYHQ